MRLLDFLEGRHRRLEFQTADDNLDDVPSWEELERRDFNSQEALFIDVDRCRVPHTWQCTLWHLRMLWPSLWTHAMSSALGTAQYGTSLWSCLDFTLACVDADPDVGHFDHRLRADLYWHGDEVVAFLSC